MKIVREFREFISKGNVLDLAVGVIIGGAFGKIVTSIVNDLLMPLVGWLFGGLSFEHLKYVYQEADEARGIAEGAINYGSFITAVVNFFIIALTVFIFVKLSMSVRHRRERDKEPAPEEPAKPTQEELLGEIRDILLESRDASAKTGDGK